MADSLNPQVDPNNGTGAQDNSHAAGHGVNDLQRSGAMTSLQHAVRAAKECDNKQCQSYCSACPFMDWLLGEIAKPVVWVALLAMAYLGATGYLYHIRFFEEGEAMVAVTVVIGFLGLAQLATTISQWQTAHEQNRLMAKQTQHTEETVKQMRLERRAWIAIDEVKFKTISEGRKIKCTVTVNNSGGTPGKIIAGTVMQFVTGKDFDDKSIKDEFEQTGFTNSEEYLVNPGKPVNMQVFGFEPLPQGQPEKIRVGDMEYHVLCRFKYIDISEEPHEIKGFYTYIPSESRVHPGWHEVNTRGNYCCFP